MSFCVVRTNQAKLGQTAQFQDWHLRLNATDQWRDCRADLVHSRYFTHLLPHIKAKHNNVSIKTSEGFNAKGGCLLQSAGGNTAASEGPFCRRPIQQLGQNTRAVAGQRRNSSVPMPDVW